MFKFISLIILYILTFRNVSYAALGSSIVSGVTAMGNSVQSSFSQGSLSNGQIPATWSTPVLQVAQERGSYTNGGDQTSYTGGGGMQSGGHGSTGGNSYGMVAGSGMSNGGQGSEAAQSMTYHYYHYPGPGGSGGGGNGGGGGWGPPKGDDDDDDLSSLLPLAGLLGLKGLKGLKGAFAIFKLLKLLLFPLLLLFLPLLLLPLLFLLLFIPIPVFAAPAGGGRIMTSPLSIGEMVSEKIFNSVQVTQQVLNGPKCMDRIACEISRKSKDTFMDKIIRSLFDMMGNYLPEKWRRTMQTYVDTTKVSSEKCSSSYPCNEIPYFSESKTTESKKKPSSPSISVGKQKRNGTSKAA